MNDFLKNRLTALADKYECPDFIKSDPVQFPHRYTLKQDIEISAFVSAWMAYGSRKVFLGILDRLHRTFDSYGGPYDYILDEGFRTIDISEKDKCLYRFYKWGDFLELCERLNLLYREYGGLENLFCKEKNLQDSVLALCRFFDGVNGIPVPESKSANKRLYMFLRWMIRQDSSVDFGLWKSFPASELIIPLDTHVYQEARKMGLTSRCAADLKTAHEITLHLAEIWPDDPVKGDFALYGLGVDQ